MIWKDRKYINPRKRVFKNMDTNDILNLELQDDDENIEEESETPLNAHNLNQAQQDLLDDMSKTYIGTSITAPTVAGYGRINKLYGHTIEEGTGEKSPSNPYTLRCVADDVNLYNENSSKVGNFIDGSGTEVDGAGYFFIKQIIIPNSLNYIMSYDEATTNANVRFSYYNNNTFLSREVKSANKAIFAVPSNCTKIDIRVDTGADYFKKLKIQKGSVATPYSPYGKGTVENISKNGDNQSSNVVATKPLCGIGEVKDELDYDGQIVRPLDVAKFNGSEEWTKSSATDFDRFVLYTSYDIPDGKIAISNMLEYNQGEDWSVNEFRLDNYQNGHRVIVNLAAGSMTLEQFKAKLAQTNLIIVFQRGTPLVESIDCSNKIVQYGEQTTVYNRDGAKIEVALTNNEAISGLNEDIGNVESKVNKMSNYSTEETVIGTRNGRKVYRKEIQATTLTDGLLKLNIPIDEMLNWSGKIITNNGTYSIPGSIIRYVQGTGNVVTSIAMSFLDKNSWSPNSIYVVTDKTITDITGYNFIIEYTKTTD